MNAIMGTAQRALRTELTPCRSAVLQKILGSAPHLLAILNDILDFSKIDAGKLIGRTGPARGRHRRDRARP